MGLGAARMQKHGCEDPDNMCQSLSGAHGAVWCSWSVSLPTAPWFLIKPSPNGVEGGMGLPSPSDGTTVDSCAHRPCRQHQPSRAVKHRRSDGGHAGFTELQRGPERVHRRLWSNWMEGGPVAPSQGLPSKQGLRQGGPSFPLSLNLLAFDKLINIFAIKGSTSARFMTPYHVTTLYTTS